MTTENAEANPRPIRDLPDFYLRWPEYRDVALAAAASAALSPPEREVVLWLTRLADRVGERDLDGRTPTML